MQYSQDLIETKRQNMANTNLTVFTKFTYLLWCESLCKFYTYNLIRDNSLAQIWQWSNI